MSMTCAVVMKAQKKTAFNPVARRLLTRGGGGWSLNNAHALLPVNACNAVKKNYMTTIMFNVTGPSNSTTGPRLASPVEMVYNFPYNSHEG